MDFLDFGALSDQRFQITLSSSNDLPLSGYRTNAVRSPQGKLIPSIVERGARPARTGPRFEGIRTPDSPTFPTGNPKQNCGHVSANAMEARSQLELTRMIQLSPTQKDMSFLYQGNDVGVLLFHGLTGTPVEMRYVGKGLAKAGFTVYGAQLAGHCGNESDLAATGWKDWVESAQRGLDMMRGKVRKLFVGGLSMGAVISLHLASQRPDDVDGLLLYGPTLKYDGWTIPWYSFLLKLLISTPIGKRYVFMEKHPYGIKDDRLRARVVRNMMAGNSADAGLAGLPSFCLKEMWALSDVVESELSKVKAPSLILHAKEDDVASLKNPLKILAKVAGPSELVLLNDSYHMITVDRERETVVERSIEHIFRVSGATRETEFASRGGERIA